MKGNRIPVKYAPGGSVVLLFLSSLATNGTFMLMINIKILSTQKAYGVDTQGLGLNIKNITVNKTSDNTTAVKVIFAVHNPEANTVLLDGIHYNVYVNNVTISSGDIGSEAVIDVMRSEPEFPVLSNDTLTLKDMQAIHTNEVKNDIMNSMITGKACFAVNGTYFYRQAANLSASGGGNEFQLRFPDGCR